MGCLHGSRSRSSNITSGTCASAEESTCRTAASTSDASACSGSPSSARSFVPLAISSTVAAAKSLSWPADWASVLAGVRPPLAGWPSCCNQQAGEVNLSSCNRMWQALLGLVQAQAMGYDMVETLSPHSRTAPDLQMALHRCPGAFHPGHQQAHSPIDACPQQRARQLAPVRPRCPATPTEPGTCHTSVRSMVT